MKVRETNPQFLYATSGRLQESPSVRQLFTYLAPVNNGTTCQEVLDRFLGDSSLNALPVVDPENIPVSLIQRTAFVEFFARPFVKDLHGRKAIVPFLGDPKLPFANGQPIIVDESTSIDDVAQMIVSGGMENMVTGFIVTRGGAYLGLANGHNLLNEITQRKQADLYFAAHYDHLTGIPNRMLLADRLVHACRESSRKGSRVGLLFIDLDRFKEVNDSMGHASGDKLLIQVAERLRDCLRSEDTVGRIGGDEFAVAVANLATPDDIGPIAQKIVATLATPFLLDGRETRISGSVGVTIYPDDAREADELFRNADTAMYRAKEQGRDNYQFYLPAMNERLAQRRQLEKDLREALERGEFELNYQPKAELDGGTLSGFEALLRWRHPRRGLVSPLEFVPVLEDTGLIVPVGEWVLKSVCEQIRQWREQGIAPLPVAVNMSARQFQRKALDSFVACMAATGVDCALIKLELTESMLMRQVEETVGMLHQLKATGVRLSVDDFGTGYSSLAYLKRFPLDEIKIDRTFIRDITFDPDDAEITLAIINMAHSLGFTAVAEGVETQAQLSFLRAHGCDEMQGYYFARPLNVVDCTAMLRNRPRLSMATLDDSTEGLTTVLLVDDNQADIELMRRTLEPCGYRVIAAANPQQAYDALAMNRIGIVISDHEMPEITGVKFLARVRTLYPQAVRIMLSGVGDHHVVTGAVNEAGIHKFLSKSWEAERLRSEVREAHLRRSDHAPRSS